MSGRSGDRAAPRVVPRHAPAQTGRRRAPKRAPGGVHAPGSLDPQAVPGHDDEPQVPGRNARPQGLARETEIADRAADTLLGTVGWYWIGKETNWLAIGVALYDPTTWGKGIGYQALGMWCEYLWAAMPQIVRLDLRTWSGNHGMIRLAEKLGFQREACFRKARIVGGEYYDGLGSGMLREEWRERYLQGFEASRVTPDIETK